MLLLAHALAALLDERSHEGDEASAPQSPRNRLSLKMAFGRAPLSGTVLSEVFSVAVSPRDLRDLPG